MEKIFEEIGKLRKEIIGKSGKKEYRYYTKLKCIKCGFEKESHSTDRFRVTKVCKICEAKKHNEELIGYENNVYKVLEYSHSSKDRSRLFYKVKCKICGHEHTCRKDQIKKVKKFCSFCRTNSIIPTEKAPENVYFCQYRHGAKSRGMNFELTKEEFKKIISENCHYCNEPPKPIQSLKTYTRCKNQINVNGIDRLNPNKGYEKSNIVTCCQTCNRMKMKMEKEDFLNKINQIYLNFIKGSTTIPEGSTLQANGNGNGETLNRKEEYDIV